MTEMRLLSSNLNIFPRSLVETQGIEYGLAQSQHERKLVVMAPIGSMVIDEFEGENSDFKGQILLLCPLSPHNVSSLRKHLPWLNPQLLGLNTSAGMGDRLGMATPGHVRAVRATQGKVSPIFAQQSIREMQRTGRNPQQVMDDATWGIFEEGWQAGIGSDADHLKSMQDIDFCLAAGFTLYTIDPGQFVNNQTDRSNRAKLNGWLAQVPVYLQPKATGLLEKTIDVNGYRLTFDETVLTKAVVKYGRAIEHTVAMVEHLKMVSGSRLFEVEISMDETEQPISPAEHVYIANELRRLGISWISFAPRFVGRFEKGVDYIGDLATFESQLAIHAAIARQFGPYKLSLHSGSDKFSIYSIFNHYTNGLAHLKTAGTSYLEALRTIAALDVRLFKEIYCFAREHFENDKKSYHISAQVSRAPKLDEINDWPSLLDQFDARQILHVTFGSVLTEKMSDGSLHFYNRIMQLLQENRESYFDNLVKHFRHHLEPFSTPRSV